MGVLGELEGVIGPVEEHLAKRALASSQRDRPWPSITLRVLDFQRPEGQQGVALDLGHRMQEPAHSSPPSSPW